MINPDYTPDSYILESLPERLYQEMAVEITMVTDVIYLLNVYLVLYLRAKGKEFTNHADMCELDYSILLSDLKLPEVDEESEVFAKDMLARLSEEKKLSFDTSTIDIHRLVDIIHDNVYNTAMLNTSMYNEIPEMALTINEDQNMDNIFTITTFKLDGHNMVKMISKVY